MTNNSRLDILLYGATGFTGKLTAAYLDQHPELVGRRWAIAGRNAASLEAVRATLDSEQVEVVVCPLTDADAVDAMVASTQVVITTDGPFSTHDGEKLLAACARAGVHYSDLSGEGFWQREMIDQYHGTAVASGAKIVLGGGVDSIPSDLGAYLALRGVGSDKNSDEPVRLTGVYTEYSGAFSGGTLASGKARELALSSKRITPAALNNPYILAPGAKCSGSEESTLDGMPRGFRGQLDRSYGMLLPFFMGKINAPIVRRSLALRGLADVVTYRECCSPGMWARAAWLYGSRGFGYPLGEPINFKPKSGEGPPSWMLTQGAFTVYVTAEAADGRSATAVVAGKGDPGYGATSKMLGEVALCLLHDQERKPTDAGVLTPATALGDALVERLAAAQGGAFMRLELT
ncbi:MAG: saccharopine dehydrogenase [Pseudomonadales bacterium]|nr:saccharopine dehydrogenase [Pseudomonadales bacterium]